MPFGSPIMRRILAGGVFTPTPTPTPTPSPGFDWSTYEAPLDPSIMSTLFQDVAGTTVVTADGQNVACVKHPTTDTILYTSVDTDDCYRYVANSGKPYLEPKTANSKLQYAAGLSNVGHYFLAMRQTAVTNFGRIISPNIGGDVGPDLGQRTGGTISFGNNGTGGVDTTTAPSATTDFVLEALTTGSGSSTPPWGGIYVNGALEAGGTGNTVPGSSQVRGFNLGNGGAFGGTTQTGLRIYGACGSQTQISGAARTALNTYLASRF